MANSTPIYSSDLYQPGQEDQLKLLHARLVQIQMDIKNMTVMAHGLKSALGGLNVNNGNSQKQIIDLAKKVEQLNRELERTKQAHQKTQQEIERTRAAEERRLAQSIRAEGVLSREIDQANERRAASTRRQQASDQALDQKRIASAQRVADNQRRINAGIQANAQKTAAAIANMNAIASARVGAINQSRGISQARANAQAAIQAQRLAVAQNQAATSSIRLSIAQNQNAASALRLAQAQRRAEEAAKRKTSTFSGLLGSIRNLTYAYFSLSAAQQIVGKLFGETKALNTLDAAFKQTLGSIQQVTEAKQFLIDITTRYGADLLTASNAYLKFGTAAKQAGVSAKVTNDIFESFTKASSVLGLGAERTSYVFLALEQIMSKGRLSTEELRRQLGEHLPGAFGIAAQAMGVTTAKLTDMLKKGEIASTDFLPKFAKQIEIAYGIQNVKKVDNLAAAQGRFNNEITLLIRKLDVAQGFKDFFNALSSGVKFISNNITAITSLTKALVQLGLAYVAWKTAMVTTNALQSLSTGIVGRAVRMQGLFTVATTLAGRAIKSLGAALAANPLGAFLSAVIILWPQINKLADSIMGVTEGMRAMEDALDSMRTSVIDETDAIHKQLAVLGDLNSTQAERIAAFNDLRAAYPGILNSYDLEKIALGDLITLEHQLTTAIVARSKEARKAEITKQLLADLEAANRAVPFGLGLNSKEGAASQTEAYRKTLKGEAYTLASEKLAALDQASLDLDLFLQKQIEAGANINQLDALRIKYRAKELEFQKELTKLSDEELQNILDAEKAKGRSFGQVDPYFDLRKKIASEILTSRAKPEGDGEAGKGKAEKDPIIAELDRLIELNKLQQDSLDTRIAAVTLAYQKEKQIHKDDSEFIVALNEQFYRDLLEAETKYYDEEAKKQKEASDKEREAFTSKINERAKDYKLARDRKESERKNNVDALRDEFEARRKHEKEIFDLSAHTSEETNAFELRMKAQELDDEIQLHRAFGKVLSDEELKRAIELRDKIREKLGKDGKGLKKKSKEDVTDIFSLLGINFGGDTDKLDAFKQTISFIGDELKGFTDLQKELVDQQIEDADRLVKAKEENLNRQIALAAANQANNVAGAQAELALAKKTQEEALKQRKKVQKQELAIDTLSQSSNLITAISAALKLGPILGPIAVGAILATFAASKIKALQLINKKTFRQGGFEEIKGGSHESGRDTHVGGNNWAEKDESVGIFNAKATRKYKPTLRAFVNAANKGVLEQILIQDRRAIQGMNFNQNIKVDTSVMEKRLGTLVSLSQRQSFVDGQGRLNIIDRGRKTIVK